LGAGGESDRRGEAGEKKIIAPDRMDGSGRKQGENGELVMGGGGSATLKRPIALPFDRRKIHRIHWPRNRKKRDEKEGWVDEMSGRTASPSETARQ